ncbi:MAG: hypothetical protein LBP37_03130 [Spirochaetaceae bacterium]|jgi:hypothetical protein|nr:hypothetical protein [Spirochaetaceae bacterium]
MKLRLYLPLVTLLLSLSCKTTPPAPETVPNDVLKDISTEESAEIIAPEKIPGDAAAPVETTPEPPEFVARAEETMAPLDENADVPLADPVYNMSEPEVIGALEEAPPVSAEPAEPPFLDEAVEKPVETASGDPTPAEPEAGVTETGETPPDGTETDGAETGETLPGGAEAAGMEAAETPPGGTEVDGTEAAETPPDGTESDGPPPPPPPPPAVALRPSEPLATSPPPVPKNPPEAVKAQPILPARNPPTETERYVKPVVNRTIRVQTGQTFEVPFDGTGWIYTGEENSKSGVRYDSRRVYDASQTFVFRAGTSGDYTLKFYRQDFLKDYVTNEYVRVLVTDEGPPVETAALPEASSGSAAPAESAPLDVVSPEAGEAVENGDPLQDVREAIAAQKYADAIALLDKFQRQRLVTDDEVLWLYGQAFEAATPARDIRAALDAYSSIVRDYPQSKYYKPAQNRIAFLNKFYFNIR